MKKISIIIFVLSAIFTLTACSNHVKGVEYYKKSDVPSLEHLLEDVEHEWMSPVSSETFERTYMFDDSVSYDEYKNVVDEYASILVKSGYKRASSDTMQMYDIDFTVTDVYKLVDNKDVKIILNYACKDAYNGAVENTNVKFFSLKEVK